MYIVASDYDGTLNIDGTVDPDLVRAIADFRARGHKFSICTGRPIESIYEQVLLYGIPFDFIIGMNGSIGVDTDLKRCFGEFMHHEDVFEVQAILENHGFLHYSVSDGVVNLMIEPGIKKHEEFEDLAKKGVRGFYVLKNSPEEAKEMSDWLNDSYPEATFKAYPNRDYVSISVRGSHKANGVRNLISYTGWDGEVLTFGDDFNDIPMLKAFTSYGIESGVSEAIAYAKHITPNVQSVLDSLD